MTPEQAKDILAVFRPGIDDKDDPLFAEALAVADTNPELNAWFTESLAFDRAMKAELGKVVAPASVRGAILAEQKIFRPPWWEHKLTGRQWAAAAAVALLAG